jgi:excinuclease UvrABC nuclease subunit
MEQIVPPPVAIEWSDWQGFRREAPPNGVPNEPGVYEIRVDYQLVYVGASSRIRNRLNSHRTINDDSLIVQDFWNRETGRAIRVRWARHEHHDYVEAVLLMVFRSEAGMRPRYNRRG